MKTLYLSILISSCIILLNVVPLQNASGFLIAETPLQTYHNSDIILVGKVASLQKTGNFTETYHYDIQVEEYVKNKQTNSTISVIASGRSIPSPPKFEIGDRVLLILNKEDGNYVVSANSFKTIPGCSSHEMLGFWAFPDEPFPQNTRSEFRANKSCLGPLIEIWPSNDVFFSPLLQFKSGTSPIQVSCKQYTVLVIKSVDNLPACVKPKSADRLVTQGWIPGPINKITTDLHNVYYTDDKIDFSINFIGFVKSCDYPHVTILDSNHGTLWKGGNLVQICDPTMGLHPVYVNQTYHLSNGLGGPMTINQTGDYIMQISFHDQSLDSDFTVISEPKFNSSTECEIKFKPKEFQSGIFPNGTSYTINYVPVFLMKPNSTGKLCINYWSIDKSFNYSGKTFPGTSEINNSARSYITMTTYPENIFLDNMTNKTIIHTITASKYAKGFFEISPMFYNCMGLPLAVGYNSTHSFDNDFPWLWDTPPCPFGGIQSQIIGISGIDVAYIKKEYH